MEQFKLGQLISNFEFVVGIMKVIENKTPEAFLTALLDYQKIKNQLVWKSSIRLKIGETEYCYSLTKVEDKLYDDEPVNEEIDAPKVEVDMDWEQSLSANIVKKLIINHYLTVK